MVHNGYFGCEEVLHRLAAFLDGEHQPEDDQSLRDHLSWCEKCLRKYRFERQLLHSLRAALKQVEAPPDLAARIAAILAIENVESSGGRST